MSGRYFHGLHLRLNNLYSDYCQDCNLPLWRGNEGEDFVNQDFNLALNSNSTVFKALIKAVNDAYQKLHSKGNYNAQDIQEYSQLIDATNDVFQDALKKGVGDNVIPAKMKQALNEDIFLFSALKTHAQLFEASRLLQTEDGKVKSFNAFSNDVAKIKADYNQSYLEAEYQFAQSSAQQAANWADIEENKGRYNLQYRTANDDRVRDSHALLNGVTLPAEDAFWNEYYPPNGWRCRCVAVEVLKDKYPTDDSVAAIEKGQKATSQIGKDGKNRLEIFRFNPGKQKVIFPPTHPYRKLAGADGVVNAAKGMFEEKQDIHSFFNSYSKDNPSFFVRGFKEIAVEKKAGNNGSTDMNGRIWLKQDRINHIEEGLKNIRNGVKTTLEQEDAFSTLHHEMWHNANKAGNMRLTKQQIYQMELANEFVSRKTLPDFMKSIGGELSNTSLISDRKSTGYNEMVRNYDQLISWSGSNSDDVLKVVKDNLINGRYDKQIDGLVDGIMKNANYKLKKSDVKNLIKECYSARNEDAFKILLETNNNLLIKK